MDIWPFGKSPEQGGHRGKTLDELPEQYITQWCLGSSWLSAFWRQKLEEELEARRRRQESSAKAVPMVHFPAHLQEAAEGIILAGFRQCRQEHATEPARLQMLNQARDLLEKFCGLA